MEEKNGFKNNIESSYSKYEGDITPFSLIDILLKKPGKLVYEIINNSKTNKHLFILFIVSFISMMIFGIVNGLFSGGIQIFFAAVKYPLGLFISAIICLPSLYIFLSLTGLDLKLRSVIGIFLFSITLISILLVGMAPVLWIFSQSTEQATFMGALNFVFWIISIIFGFNLLIRILKFLSKKEAGFIVVWVIIFVLVTFQMSTTLRPLIGKSDTFITHEKRFFIDHWFGKKSNINKYSRPNKTSY